DQGGLSAMEPIGHIHSISGSQVSIGLLTKKPGTGAGVTVGRFVKVKTNKALLVGVITDVSAQTSLGKEGFHGVANIDLVGELNGNGSGAVRFQRGVTDYPTIGDLAATLNNDEMRVIFDRFGPKPVKIGHLQQDSSISVCVDIDEVLNKHF